MLFAAIVVLSIIGLVCLGLFALCVASFHRMTWGRVNIRGLMSHESKRVSLIEMLPIIASGVVVIILLCIEIIAMVTGM
jgi:hypothetical protein